MKGKGLHRSFPFLTYKEKRMPGKKVIGEVTENTDTQEVVEAVTPNGVTPEGPIETITEDVEVPKKTGQYENTTTSSKFVENPAAPVVVSKRVVQADPKLKVVTPKESREFRYGRKWYKLKRGEQTAVPVEVFQDLARCDVIVER